MPTRTGQKNPKGLSQAARLALELQPEVSSILERLSKHEDFAAWLDDAVVPGISRRLKRRCEKSSPGPVWLLRRFNLIGQ